MGIVAPFSAVFTPQVFAQVTPTSIPTTAPAANPTGTTGQTDVTGARGANDSARLMSEYWEATKDCSVPSLECLVYHTVNFVGIELVVSSLWGGMTENPLTGTLNDLNNSNGNPIVPTTDGSPLLSNTPQVAGNYARPKTGAIDGLTGMISAMYDEPPATTQTYLADAMNNAGIATPAYAQGLGFAALNPVLGLWKIFRNLAYTFFIFLFIIIGFMIMLRTKIGNQTAVTVQQAIPQIITSLIFVTFSYAIAGFMIDLMYVMMALIIGLFHGPLEGSYDNIGSFLGMNIFDLFRVFSNAAEGLDSGAIIGNMLKASTSASIGTGFVGGLGGIIVSTVIAIALVIGWFRLFFELAKSYATVLLSIVTAPIVLMIGAIPGQNAFVPWLKDLIGNLLPFPTVVMVLAMYYVFTEGAVNTTNGGFMPPFLIGGGQSSTLVSILGVAIILALPEIVKAVKKPLVKEGFGTMVINAGAKSFGVASIPAAALLGQGAYTAGRTAIAPFTGFGKTRDKKGLGPVRVKAYGKHVRQEFRDSLGAGVKAGAGFAKFLGLKGDGLSDRATSVGAGALSYFTTKSEEERITKGTTTGDYLRKLRGEDTDASIDKLQQAKYDRMARERRKLTQQKKNAADATKK